MKNREGFNGDIPKASNLECLERVSSGYLRKYAIKDSLFWDFQGFQIEDGVGTT